ncbi:MAG: 50S ribosomal protein L24e [Thermoplasmata archaeon]
MVEKKVCSFCSDEIESGTGKMFVKKDGSIFHFCSMKCQKNMLVLKRIPRETRWTRRD